MARVATKIQDETTRTLYQAIRKAFPEVPDDIERVVYRYNPVAIRVKVVSKRFEGKDTDQRERMVMRALKTVPSNIVDDITMLLMFTPEEENEPHLLSEEFEDPNGSRL